MHVSECKKLRWINCNFVLLITTISSITHIKKFLGHEIDFEIDSHHWTLVPYSKIHTFCEINRLNSLTISQVICKTILKDGHFEFWPPTIFLKSKLGVIFLNVLIIGTDNKMLNLAGCQLLWPPTTTSSGYQCGPICRFLGIVVRVMSLAHAILSCSWMYHECQINKLK